MKRRTKIGLTVVGLAVAGLVGASVWYVFSEDYGVSVDSVGWLPPEARGITYLRNYLTWMAEFDIEREAFETWCGRRGMPLRELGEAEHQEMFRCLAMLEHRGIISPLREPNAPEAGRRSCKRFSAGGLFYEDRWDNGGGYCVGYDVKEKRGYYWYGHH